jgi:hypothetical protein
LDQDSVLQIRLKSAVSGPIGDSIGRFRLSVTYDDIQFPDTKQAALTLLLQLHRQNPANYWANLELAELLSRQIPPDFEGARRDWLRAIHSNISPTPAKTASAITIDIAIHNRRVRSCTVRNMLSPGKGK